MALITPNSTSARHVADPWNEDVAQCAERAKAAIGHYLCGCAPTFSELANFSDTPVRAAKAHLETKSFLTSDAHESVFRRLVTPKPVVLKQAADVLATGFPMEPRTVDCGIVVQGPIFAKGVCPHHLLPVFYAAYVAYQPERNGTVLGLSKLSRLTQILAGRPVLQEQVGADIADALHYDPNTVSEIPQIKTAGSAVQLIGWHSCMASRGVRSEAATLTTVLRGSFSNAELKAEFYQAIRDLAPQSYAVPSWVVDPRFGL